MDEIDKLLSAMRRDIAIALLDPAKDNYEITEQMWLEVNKHWSELVNIMYDIEDQFKEPWDTQQAAYRG
jgi:hypothetical protein